MSDNTVKDREPFIRVEGLSHIYNKGMENEYRALDNINLDIYSGEFVAVLGANGSGKSTLARHLNGLLLPTDGHCYIDGMDTLDENNTWSIRQQVGMVFQNPDNQIIAAVVEDDVAFGPENLGLPPEEIRRRVTESLKAVGMEDYRHFAPNLLSGGQKQRVAIAGALAMNTACIVLDEPTAMLNPSGRRDVLDTVLRLNKEQGITVVFITHYMEEAAKADRIVVMDGGKMVANGTPREIFAKVSDMKKYGLDVPLATEAALELRKKGIKLPESIIFQEELVKALCQLK